MKLSDLVPRGSVRPRLTVAVGFLLACIFGLAPPLAAAPGGLDPSFGTGGKVLTGFLDGSDDRAAAVAIQSDGKIVVAGNSDDSFAVARYNPDGTLDTGFGSQGRVITSFGNFSFDQATAVAIQADGKIVVAGSSDFIFAVARYNTNGTLDASFGTGGKVTTAFGEFSFDQAMAVAIQADGKIVVAGSSDANSTDDFYRIGFAIARYNTNGTLDTTFSSDGKVITNFGTLSDDSGTDDEAFAIAIQPDGKIVVAGFSDVNWETTGVDFALARYNTRGLLDGNFGRGGKVTTDMSAEFDDQAFALALQSDGKVVVAGLADSVFGVARYTTGGALDTTFGTGGVLTTAFGDFSFDQAAGVAIQSDGKIVVVGSSDSSFAVARYTATGILDAGFGAGGKVTTAFGDGSFDQGAAVALQADGKIVVVGTSDAADAVDDFALARYLATVDTAPPDTSILSGPTGSVTTSSVTFAWTGTDAVTLTATLTYAFRLDPLEPAFSAFGSAVSKTYTALGNGSYTFYVKARDEAGNEDATPASRSFTVNPPGTDVTAPDTSIVAGPTGTITTSSAAFTWTGTDDITPTANLTYAFRLDPLEPTFSAFGSAVSKTYTGLGNGSYTFYVKARDQAGNEDATPASRSFTVSSGDTIPPDTLITSGPRRTMTLNEVSFSWTGTDNLTPVAGLTYAFRLDPLEPTFSAFGSAVSKTYVGLPNGDYTFYVKARDQAGNEDATPATLDFTVAVGIDLAEVAVSDPPASATPGSKFSVTDTVKNLGSLTARRSTTRYYLSIARQRGGGDRLLNERRAVPSLDGGLSSTGTLMVTIPPDLPLGLYYLLACADAAELVGEVDESNNCRASAATVLVGKPDLVETFVSDPPVTLRRGDVFQVTDTAKNQGTIGAAVTTTRYYLSAETVKRPGAKLLSGGRAVPVLAAGAQSTDVVTITVPRTLAYGTYYLLACADDTRHVSENDEANNCVTSAGQVTVGP